MKATVQAAASCRSNVPGRLGGFRRCPDPSESRVLSRREEGGPVQAVMVQRLGPFWAGAALLFLLGTYPQRLRTSACLSLGIFVRTAYERP